MAHRIQRVAVLGAGVMGAGIAAHLANAGIDSLLYDIVPAGAEDRNILAKKGIEVIKTIKPAALYRTSDLSRVKPANYEDHTAELATCDWIIEVVVERLDIKNKVFEWVAKHRRPGSIVSTNTSGLPMAEMVAHMPAEMREHFLVTHFFNPVRYMRLLELVAGPDTKPEVTQAIATFGERKLGKGIVFAKDTPNFIANRIGTFGIAAVFQRMAEHGLTVEEVDAVFGPAMGRPGSAVFRTADLVGLDTLAHVFKTVYDKCPADERRDWFQAPAYLKKLIESGKTGDKVGEGFYKKVKVDGKSDIFALDVQDMEYKPKSSVRLESTGKARNIDDVGKKVKVIVGSEDKGGKCAWAVTADTLVYAANRIPEIADDIVNIDRGMAWGFGWELGPFQTWDAIGVKDSVAKMEAEGRTVPAWVKGMLEKGRESFYARDAAGVLTYWDVATGAPRAVPKSPSHLLLADQKAQNKEVFKNPSASLVDLGDGVLGLEFHAKMNAIDDMIMAAYGMALDKLDAGEFEALVVGNQDGKAFCAGANIFMMLMGAKQGQWDQIDGMVKGLQGLLMRAKYSPKPVVTAPYGLVLGGGCEVAMQSSATQAAGELYMGLVEVGVGLIPAGGGCKEMLFRTMGGFPQDTNYDPNPFVQKAFERIATAKVSMSAEEARDFGYLRPQDRLTLDSDGLVYDAKRLALGLVQAGYAPPRQGTVKVPGRSGVAAIELFLYQMKEGGYATPHDAVVGQKLAHVMTGGDRPAGATVTEQDVLDLEREAFLSLCGMEATQARMEHMLMKGKPLRN